VTPARLRAVQTKVRRPRTVRKLSRRKKRFR